MKPEGPSNAVLVFVKVLAFCWLVGFVGYCTLNIMFGWTYQWWLTRMPLVAWMIILLPFVAGALTVGWTRKVSADVNITDREQFIAQATEALVKCQYQLVSSDGSTWMFKTGFPMGFLYGVISVQVGDSTARLVGPSIYVKQVLHETGCSLHL